MQLRVDAPPAKEFPMSPIVFTFAAVLSQAGAAPAAKESKADALVCPMHEQHMKQRAAAQAAAPDAHHEQLLERGAKAMGFDQRRTSHHFRLSGTGGSIEVHVNDSADAESKRQIDSHLRLIARQFAAGDFGIPLATHGEEPAGVSELKRLRGQIRYQFEETPLGGRVVIATGDAQALAAVHAFLRYQIQDHQTGDAATPERR
jgi:hypothetical protein